MIQSVLNELSPDECLRLLASVLIGGVGLSMAALPVVLPVNFALLDGDIVFRTVEGTKFHTAALGAVVAFEADGYDPSGARSWSVLVQGVSAVVTDPSELMRVRELSLHPWGLDVALARLMARGRTWRGPALNQMASAISSNAAAIRR